MDFPEGRGTGQTRMKTRTVRCKIGNAKYTLQSDDEYLKRIGRVFEPGMTRLFGSLIEEGGNAIDAGANIGCTSLFFASLCREVHAFEPSPTTFAFLRENVESNGAANVVLHNCGLGDAAHDATLTYAPQMRAGAFISDTTQASAGHVTEAVQVVNGDAYLKETGIAGTFDFIKLDVEGFELEAIRGLRQTIERDRPLVCLEMNHWCLNAFQRITIPDFLDTLLDTFPVLLAIDKRSYADLRNNDQKYTVMHQHILHRRFSCLVGAFDNDRLARFYDGFSQM